MKMNVVGRKLIKPSTPTPPNLRNYTISYIDEISPAEMDVPILLFFESKPKEISQLEESLAQILPQFYPLAGRYISKDHRVECSDEGVEFIEAEASDAVLSDIVGASTTEELKYVLPRINFRVLDASDPILSVQVTQFQCGGLVIGICVSHKICDASSLATLITAWSNATNPEGKISVTPSFDCSSFFPPKMMNDDICSNSAQEVVEPAADPREAVAKRFVFNKQCIGRLRSKLMEEERQAWISRVRVATAVIAKALMGVARARNGGGKPTPTVISHVVNMRGRTIPPLHKHACGNLGILALTRRIEEEEIGVEQVVSVLDDALNKSISDCAVILSGGQSVLDSLVGITDEMLASGEQKLLMFSDWSKFGFYEADFGWGKPVWAAIGPIPSENVIVLMDSAQGDGIEAWVHLFSDGMPYFEQELAKLIIIS